MKKNMLQIVVSAIALSAVLAACRPVRPATPVPQTATYEPQVQSITVQLLQSKPVGVAAVVRGNMSESCATLQQPQVQYTNGTFQITLLAVTPIDRGCAAATTPFETTVPLDVNGLPAGNYTVTANGISAVFTLAVGAPTSSAPTASVSPVPVSSGSCTDAAAFVTDVSIPDGFHVAPGTEFTKIWRLKNTGSCAWNSSYIVSYITGTTMTQQPGYILTGGRVDPGQTVDINVWMSAPIENGNYTSYWGLKGRNGQLMPIQGGANGNSFFVKIRVDDGTFYDGKIIAYSADMELAQGSAPACTPDASYVVTVNLTADGPVKAHVELTTTTAGGIPAGNLVGATIQDQSTSVEANIEFSSDRFPQGGGVQGMAMPYGFVGPYPHPDDITLMVRVDGGPWHTTRFQCP